MRLIIIIPRLLTEVAAFLVRSFRSWTINGVIHSVWCFVVCFVTIIDCPGAYSTFLLDV